VRHLALVRVKDIQLAIVSNIGKSELPDAEKVAAELGNTFGYLNCYAMFAEMRVLGQPIPFLRALLASRTCNASDRRDYIYAIKGSQTTAPSEPTTINTCIRSISRRLETSFDKRESLIS
jgi:hypothetical protein